MTQAQATVATQAPETTTEQRDGQEMATAREAFVAPVVDICEDEQGLVVVADLPGVTSDALDVRVEQRVLTIQGRAQHLATGQPMYREFELTGFFRQFQLPDEVDTARITAELRHGVLTLQLPRAEAAQPRHIEVKAAD